jgi:hypothetical protein
MMASTAASAATRVLKSPVTNVAFAITITLLQIFKVRTKADAGAQSAILCRQQSAGRFSDPILLH